MRWMLGLVLLCACGSGPTRLRVGVCTDFTAAEVSQIRARARDADVPDSTGESREWDGSALAAGNLTFDVTGRQGRRARIEVTFVGLDGEVLTTRVVETGFVRGRTIPVVLRVSRECVGADCVDGTCGDFGRCEAVSVPVEAWEGRRAVCAAADAGVPSCDEDGDGVESPACGGLDCDDSDPERFPGNPEVCDEVDNDCDPCTVGETDRDGDGVTSAACANPAEGASCGDDVVVDGGVVRGPDCNDDDAAVRPGADEICNLQDDDCDGAIDEGLPTEQYWPDLDGDNFGDRTADPMDACEPPDAAADNDGDCDDGNPARNPSAGELCNEVDDDCDDTIDEVTENVFYEDRDGDGFGEESRSRVVDSCEAPDGFVSAPGDCRPTDPLSFPMAAERCDRIDNDCSSDGGTDASEDADGDGHAPLDASCEGGFSTDDCDDDNEYAFLGAPEYCSGADNDCDGTVDEETGAQCASGVCEEGCVGRRRWAIGSELQSEDVTCWAGPTAVWCWGQSPGSTTGHAGHFAMPGAWSEPAPAVAADLVATEIAMHLLHVCARLEDSTLRCWGLNSRGELGIGSTEIVTGVQRVALADVLQVTVGAQHTCALNRLGRVYCWGRNEFGQLGLGDRRERNAPALVDGLDRAVEVSAAADSTCARRYNGDVFCWGELADPVDGVDLPTRIASDAQEVRLGGRVGF
ncbi:MAG: MopE-related protein, partial [Myxococcota bacterium]